MGDGSAVTMENDSLLFEMDGATTQFTVKDKKSGAVWNLIAVNHRKAFTLINPGQKFLHPGHADHFRNHISLLVFEKVGYTYEDALEDRTGGGSVQTKKPIFNVNIIYRLSGGQLSVEVPLSEIEYYEIYPVFSLDVQDAPFFAMPKALK